MSDGSLEPRDERASRGRHSLSDRARQHPARCEPRAFARRIACEVREARAASHAVLLNTAPPTPSPLSSRIASVADPDGFSGTDGPPGDARLCFGAGLLQVCLSSAPTRAVSYPTTLLDTSGTGNCTQVKAQNGGPELCIVAGSSVTIDGTLTVIGSRPLVLIAADSMTVSGTIDASSTRAGQRGAAANPSSCGMPGLGASDTGGGGGGGAGDMQNRSPGGDGGGAVYLVAGDAIHLSGDVFASGAGGGVTTGVLGAEQGGGGGGTGGMIGLDAPNLDIRGRVVANGGAGGGGGGNTGGSPGGDGTTTSWNIPAAPGVGGGTIPGGNGAPGTAIGATSNVDGASNDGGAGGGAGGLGIIVIHGAMTGDMARMSPAPTAL